MYKLDILDKKILYELDINSRQLLTQLAKKLGKNRNTIEYRIERLQEKGIIKKFVTLLDAGKLGLMVWNVYIEFQNLTPKIEKEIIEYLKDNKKVWWVALPSGKWNLIYSIFVKNIKEFYSTVNDFNSKFGHYILNQSLAAHVEVEILSRGFFLKKPAIGVTWYKTFESIKIDKTDKNILKELSTNARISSIELAKKLDITPRIVSYRIKELIKKKIITRFRLQLDVSKLGYGFYKVIVHLKNRSPKNDIKLMQYCKQLGNIFHYEKKIGPWMLELEMNVKSYEKINELMKIMKEKFPEYIKSYEIMLITSEPKGELDLTQQL
ncbi:Lrp/AsnC family transcriptional regulator [archaeon]|jgi:DNA-binding Lrp family transcriptional regulator|nr:Lrp/AsnC family transcriptional regulator [archaeon]MBT4396713.1 Lrp/AsnC family transcriptional regulator [archaeon]MBT4441323.1 Lrp/AsnC family transcriptional regulator [archaeon]